MVQPRCLKSPLGPGSSITPSRVTYSMTFTFLIVILRLVLILDGRSMTWQHGTVHATAPGFPSPQSSKWLVSQFGRWPTQPVPVSRPRPRRGGPDPHLFSGMVLHHTVTTT